MRILHYIFGLPPVRGGGLIRYATDLMEQEKKMGCEVVLLVPGRIPQNRNRKVSIRRRADYKQIPTYAVFHPLPIPMGNGILDVPAFTKRCSSDAYTVFFKQIRPDLFGREPAGCGIRMEEKPQRYDYEKIYIQGCESAAGDYRKRPYS